MQEVMAEPEEEERERQASGVGILEAKAELSSATRADSLIRNGFSTSTLSWTARRMYMCALLALADPGG